MVDVLLKTCKQCGEAKPLSAFRKYYGGRKGSYNTCKDCERINSREKYLVAKELKGIQTEAEHAELAKIYDLWTYQESLGLRPPRHYKSNAQSISKNLDTMIDKYKAKADAVKNVAPCIDIPAELARWLTQPLTASPEYYQGVVWDDLVAKYRPVQGFDTASMLPVHDETYKDILNVIATRFDEYEDTYYNVEG